MKFYARDLKENTIFEVTSALDAVSMFDTPRTTIEHFLKYKTPRLVDRRFLINKTKEALYPKYIVCKPEELLMTLKVTRRDVRTLVQTVAFENTTPKRYHDIISVLPGQLSGTALYTAYLIGRVRIGEEISILINGYRYLLTVQYPTQMMPVRVDNWDESVVGFRVQHIDTDDILGAVLVGGTPDQYKAVIDRIGKIVTLSDDLGSLAAPKHANEADILAYQKDIRKHIHALQKQGVPINDEGGPKSMVSTAVDFFHSPYTKVKFSESGWTDEKIKNAIQDMKNLQQMVDKSQTTKPVISKDMDREIRRLEIVRMRAIARSQRYIISLLHKTNVLVRSLREHAKKTQQPKK